MPLSHSTDQPLSARAVWSLGGLSAAGIAALFFLTWQSQFAAPPGYLFDTPSQPVEAGYCLSVAQELGGGGGGYVDEAARFWVARLRGYDADMGRAIADGRAWLGRDQAVQTARGVQWLFYAMDQCSNRAVSYGARFQAFG
jgi:hypothetical protein